MPRIPFIGNRPEEQANHYEARHGSPTPAGRPPSAVDGGDRAEPVGPWAPVIVGEPIYEFEPRPPAPGMYCPDTVADGWSTPDLTVRLASVRGYAHRYHGTVRQDAVAVACDQPSGTVVVAVADGVSSASLSHIGATAACQAATDMIMRQLAADTAQVNWTAVLRAAAQSVTIRGRGLLRTDRPDPKAVEQLLATTLVAGCIRPTARGPVASIVQAGDSSGWLLARDRYHPVLKQKNDPQAEVVNSAVTPLPRLPSRVAPVTVPLPADSVLLLGTDGFGDPLGDGSGQVGRLFAENLRTPPSALALAHLLDFSRETFDDDRTLVAVWPRPPDEEMPT